MPKKLPSSDQEIETELLVTAPVKLNNRTRRRVVFDLKKVFGYLPGILVVEKTATNNEFTLIAPKEGSMEEDKNGTKKNTSD